MKTIPLDRIVVADNRQRREFLPAAITELANGILKQGLLHPIVIRYNKEEDIWYLVAGERRLRAVKELHELGSTITHDGCHVLPGEIPFSTISDLDPIGVREAELTENILRVDLTWQERARAISELDAMRKEQHGTGGSGRRSGWTYADTASEIKGAPALNSEANEVSESIALVKHLDDPDVKRAKSQREAVKILKKKLTDNHRIELGKTIDISSSDHFLIRGDAGQEVHRFEVESFDVICSDPPYGVDMHKDVSWDGSMHEYDDSPETFLTLFQHLADDFFRVAKRQAHLYLFCDLSNFQKLNALFTLAGWDVWPRPFIWYKGNVGAYPSPELGPRYTYECILFANKGQRKVTALYHDVIDIPQELKHDHPAGKPSEVYHNLLKRTVNPGDSVLDPFCGSGPIFPAATRLKCRATGIEISEKYHAMSVETIAGIGKEVAP
jgi:ParB-like chromosome segregation protein Spo0J/DNA modification methylase